MTLLDPISGLVAGAIAVPALIALYFLKLRRRPVRVSSTMLWQRAVHDLQVNAPFRMIRPSWLLLLQLLALGCLLTAFARPAIDARDSASSRTVILLDRSASMSARDVDADGRRTRLDEAKRGAIDLVDRLSRASTGGARAEAVVISFAAAPRALTGFTSNAAELRRAIESVTPTDQPADLEGAVRLVQATLAQPEDASGASGAPAPARVALFSDGAFDEVGRPVRSGFGDAELVYVRVGPPDDPEAPLDNIGVVAASARRDYEQPGLVRVFARLQSTLPAPMEVALTLSVDARPLVTRTVTVPGAVDGRPGDAPVVFDVEDSGLRTDAPTLLSLTLARPDALRADDAAHMLVDPARSARILLVGPGDVGDAGVNPFLERAVRVVNPRPPDVIGAGAYELRAMQTEGLAQYDLVVFDRVRPEAVPPVPSLSFGAGLPIPGMSMTSPERARRTNVLWWRRSHPALRYVGLDPVEVWEQRVLTLPRSDADRPDPLVVETIATGIEGPLIAEIEQGRTRRLVVAFDLARSTFHISVGFPVFIANAIERLTSLGAGAPARSFTTAQPVTLRAAPGAETIRLEGPAEAVALVRPGQEDSVSVGVLPLAGLYAARGADPRDAAVPVNLVDAFESAIAVSEEVSIAGRSFAAGSLGEASPTEVWPWFVLAAFVLLVIEWLIFAFRTKV